MDNSVGKRKEFLTAGYIKLFWETVPVSHTKFIGQLANSESLNNMIAWCLRPKIKILKYNLERFQIITINFVEIYHLWVFDRRVHVASILNNLARASRYLVVWLGEFVHYKTKTLFRVAWHFWKNSIFIVDKMSKHRDFMVSTSSNISSSYKNNTWNRLTFLNKDLQF